MHIQNKHFSYNSSNPFNSVINYLREKFLSVEVNSFGEYMFPRYTIDKSSIYWIGKEGDQSLITFLLPYPIKADGYLIQTSNHPPNACHPRKWKFEASFFGIRNKISKEYSDDGKLKNYSTYACFSIEKAEYQLFKITPLTSYNDGCI